MPSKVVRNYVLNAVDTMGTSYARTRWFQQNYSTLGPNGKPRLDGANQHERTFASNRVRQRFPYLRTDGTTAACIPAIHALFAPRPPNMESLETSARNTCLAKFNGKVRYGKVDLTMVAATWRQSANMIANRVKPLRQIVDRRIEELIASSGSRRRLKRLILERRRLNREPLANEILEVEFGWKPLVQDLSGAIKLLANLDLPNGFVRAVHRTKVDSRTDVSAFPTRTQTNWDGDLRVVQTAVVGLTNPNSYMNNQLGLINPALAIWDAIPWSFVVGMFVNVNQMLSQATDRVGLTFRDISVTTGWDYTISELKLDLNFSPTTGRGPSIAQVTVHDKARTTGGLITPKWELRVPEANLELGIIAISLLVQRFKKLNKLISVL